MGKQFKDEPARAEHKESAAVANEVEALRRQVIALEARVAKLEAPKRKGK